MGQLSRFIPIFILFALLFAPVTLSKPPEGVEVLQSPQVSPDGQQLTGKRIKNAEVVQDTNFCSCIKTARQEGAKIAHRTNAEDLKPNTTPHEGALILFQYGSISHVALIKKFREEGAIIVEGNYKPCERTVRFVRWDDKYIIGFYKFNSNESL